MHFLIEKRVPPGAFEPEIVDILSGALEEAWRSARASNAPIATDDCSAARETLARAIIELALTGERNRQRLVEHALLQLSRWSMRSGGAAGR